MKNFGASLLVPVVAALLCYTALRSDRVIQRNRLPEHLQGEFPSFVRFGAGGTKLELSCMPSRLFFFLRFVVTCSFHVFFR